MLDLVKSIRDSGSRSCALFQSLNLHNHYQVLKVIISLKMTSRAQKKSLSGSVNSLWCIKSIHSMASHAVGNVLHMLRATFLLTPIEIHDFIQQQNLQ